MGLAEDLLVAEEITDTLSTKIENLKKEINTLTTSLSTLTTNVNNVKTAVDSSNSTLGNTTYGLNAIKTTVNTINTNASNAATSAANANTNASGAKTLLENSTYGLNAIKNVVSDKTIYSGIKNVYRGNTTLGTTQGSENNISVYITGDALNLSKCFWIVSTYASSQPSGTTVEISSTAGAGTSLTFRKYPSSTIAICSWQIIAFY